MHSGPATFLLRRAAFAVALVVVVSSAALALASVAPADNAFEANPAALAAERHRLGLDRPFAQQYVSWLGRAARLDLGESLRFGRPVTSLIRERAGNTLLLGLTALLLATALGLPLGVVTGSRPAGAVAAAIRGVSILLLSVPPLITSLVLLLVAVRTGWLPPGGLPDTSASTGLLDAGLIVLRHLALPALALGLPVAASIERLQSVSMRAALAEPSIVAALGRGIPRGRVVWRHALRLSLRPVLAIYGITIGSVLSGSFAVEIVMSWRGLGDLTFEALRARDTFLVAGCAAAGAIFLAGGILASDVALAAVDPRVEDAA